VFPKLPIVKFYRSKAASEGSLTVAADLAAGGVENSQNPMVSFFFNSQQVSYNCI
jgi:equilibrative nucleoside transporter 1/2/3